MTAGTEASVIQQTLLALGAEIRNYSKLGLRDRKAFEDELNKAIAQAGKLIDLSRPGKIEFGNYASLRSEAWSELRHHLAKLGVKMAENWEEHPETPVIFDDTLLNSLWPKADVKQVLKPIFKEMTEIITETRRMLPVELSVQSPPKDPFDKPASEEIEHRIRLGVAALLVWKPELGRALDSLLLDASTFATDHEEALALARKNVEQWFDATMDRTSGWYKRNVQLTLFVIGLFVASLLNIDSYTIATTLWREPTIRQALVAQAEKFELPPPTSPDSDIDPAEAIRTLSTKLSQDLKLPVGWSTETSPADRGGWSVKVLGLLLSAGAASFGAPFWFDVLDKFMNIRSAGKKPANVEDQKIPDQADGAK